MKKLTWFLPFILLAISVFSCKKESSKGIYHRQVNKEYIIKTDVQELQQSTDEVSMHIDSVLNGLISDSIVGTGIRGFDLNGDDGIDIGFEILDFCWLCLQHLLNKLQHL